MQAPSRSTDQPQSILAGWLIDGLGAPARCNVRITIVQGRIVGLEESQPDGNRPVSMDLSNATVLPALMDAHVHLVFSGTRDARIRQQQLAPSDQEANAVISAHLEQHARHGVCAVRDGGDRYGHVPEFIKSAGTRGIQGVHVSVTCWAWHAANRYGRMIGHRPDHGLDLAAALAKHLHAIDHVKVINSGLNSLKRFGQPTAPQFPLDALKVAVSQAHAKGLPVMVHANGRVPVGDAIEAGCDSIEHGYFMGSENLTRMADKSIAWVPTAIPMAALARDHSLTSEQRDVARRTLDHQLEQIRQGLELGVPIVLGTDAGSIGVDHGGAVAQEMALLVSAGLSMEQAVRSATGRAARLLGIADGGVIMPGRRADLISVAGSPRNLLSGLASVEMICLEGRWRKRA
jgi:imidazolonepropionase-like amidohydrolase